MKWLWVKIVVDNLKITQRKILILLSFADNNPLSLLNVLLREETNRCESNNVCLTLVLVTIRFYFLHSLLPCNIFCQIKKRGKIYFF